MKQPIFVRELSETEKNQLEQGLQSSAAFTVRRCQILLSSAQHKTAQQIAEELHISDQCAREAIHAFEREGLACLQEKSHARHDDQRPFDQVGLARLQEIIRLSPRTLGHDSSVWTLALLAETCWAERISRRPVSAESVGRALKSVGIQWRRAKRWIRSPDLHYEHKKTLYGLKRVWAAPARLVSARSRRMLVQ
jgi:transposase